MAYRRRLKSLIAALMCLPSVGRVIGHACGNRIRVGTCRISTTSELIHPSTKAALFWGLYESAELRLIRRYLDVRFDVIELGTSIGVVAATIAQKLNSGRQLLCVEAHPGLAEIARENIRENAPTGPVSVVTAALDYSDTAADLWLTLGSLSTGGHVTTTPARECDIPVERTTLDAVIRTYGVGKYSLVADIEGTEAALLERDRPALDGCQQLIIELHQTTVRDAVVTIDEMVSTIVKTGFRIAARDGNVFVFVRS